MKSAWVVFRLTSTAAFEVNGVFADKAQALAICDDHSGVVEVEIGRDYTAEITFRVHTPADPDGVIATQPLEGPL